MIGIVRGLSHTLCIRNKLRASATPAMERRSVPPVTPVPIHVDTEPRT